MQIQFPPPSETVQFNSAGIKETAPQHNKYKKKTYIYEIICDWWDVIDFNKSQITKKPKRNNRQKEIKKDW